MDERTTKPQSLQNWLDHNGLQLRVAIALISPNGSVITAEDIRAALRPEYQSWRLVITKAEAVPKQEQNGAN